MSRLFGGRSEGRRRSSLAVDASTFHATLQRERSRADRTGRAFALVEFRPRPDEVAAWSALAHVLAERIRAYDLLGENEDGDLCVLLPETQGDDAWRFVDAIRQRVASGGLRFAVSVHEYPHWSWRDEEDDDDRRSGARPSGAEAETVVWGVNAGPVSASPVDHDSDFEEQEDPSDVDGAALEPRSIEDLSPEFHVAVPWWKRTMDVLGAGFLLLLASPVFAVIALLIKRSSPGPVIFRQQRAGIGGEPFWFLKFRTMYLDAEARKAALRGENEVDGPVFKIKRDPRITPIGRFLRRASLDELPQLWNVFVGDMSLVGPRPPTLDEVVHYQPWQRRRLHLRGGLTCYWQVGGRSDLSFEEWMRLDARYAREPRFWRDLWILVRTPWAVLTGRGAY